MAKTFTAPFAQTNKTATAVVTAAATVADDNPANTVLLLSAGAEGTLLTKLSAMPRATNSATNLLLFLSKDGGATKRLIDSRLMSAATVSTTAAIPQTGFPFSELAPLRLEANDKLYVGAMVALTQGIVFKAEYTDF